MLDIILDDDHAALGHSVVELIEYRASRAGGRPSDPQERQLLDWCLGNGVGRPTLNEPNVIVENAESLEPIADKIEVGPEPRNSVLIETGSRVG